MLKEPLFEKTFQTTLSEGEIKERLCSHSKIADRLTFPGIGDMLKPDKSRPFYLYMPVHNEYEIVGRINQLSTFNPVITCRVDDDITSRRINIIAKMNRAMLMPLMLMTIVPLVVAAAVIIYSMPDCVFTASVLLIISCMPWGFIFYMRKFVITEYAKKVVDDLQKILNE